jgi:uncharacterized repeat protein (TIGR03803 family)
LICASFSLKNGVIAMNFRIFGLLAIAAFFTAVAPGQSRAVNLTTLVSFNGTNGASPTTAGLIADANGNLFGTTVAGGNSTNCGGPGCGTVFEVIKTSGGYASTPTTLVSFNGTNGASPTAGLTADANGNLFGTTNGGGANNCGTVFKVIKTSGGYASTPITLVSFNGTDGCNPDASLIADASGNLFGTTVAGGNSMYCGAGCGTVFEVIKTSGGYASTATTLISFNGTDGYNPAAGLIADAHGNLFGTTTEGGKGGNSTNCGGGSCGTVFEVIKTSGGYANTPTTLVSFNGTDGYDPEASLIADANGNLFGTTITGGANNWGTVFEVIKTSGGYASTPTTLVNFGFTDGALPNADLIADANGNLFSTTAAGGNSTNCGPENCGTVFEITGSGFAVFAGTPGKPNCHGQSVSALVQQYGSLAAAAAARGYSSVQVLQNDIATYCSE